MDSLRDDRSRARRGPGGARADMLPAAGARGRHRWGRAVGQAKNTAPLGDLSGLRTESTALGSSHVRPQSVQDRPRGRDHTLGRLLNEL